MTKKYLFLDDYRNPSDVHWVSIPRDAPWVIVRSFDEAVAWVNKNGVPDVVSFDHDLADEHYEGNFSQEKTGYDFAKWLVNRDLDMHNIPDGFSYYIHSMNPIGAKNIQELLNSYLTFKKG